jgi:methionine-rich copper-binding protein CopC
VSLAATQAAVAHAKLLGADPPIDGCTGKPPQKLDLLFSEGISGKLSCATVEDPDGKAIPAGAMIEKAVGLSWDEGRHSAEPMRPWRNSANHGVP